MNDRLKELAEQNGFIHKWMPPGEQHDKLQSLEKFALLIVRECARIAQNTDLEDVEGGDSAVLRAAGEQIKQHFGVE